MSAMTLEGKWDLLFPLACSVAAAIERYDGPQYSLEDIRRNGETLAHMARQLKKAVDRISPEPQSSASSSPLEK